MGRDGIQGREEFLQKKIQTSHMTKMNENESKQQVSSKIHNGKMFNFKGKCPEGWGNARGGELSENFQTSQKPSYNEYVASFYPNQIIRKCSKLKGKGMGGTRGIRGRAKILEKKNTRVTNTIPKCNYFRSFIQIR